MHHSLHSPILWRSGDHATIHTSPDLHVRWNCRNATGKAERLQEAALDRREAHALLRQIADAKCLSMGKRLHAHILRRGYESDRFLANLLVYMYGKCASLEDACAVFHRIIQPNTFSWNIMVAAFAQNGQLESARKLFDTMPKRDVVSWNAMITAYAHNGKLDSARSLFGKMPRRNLVSWNAMITAYAQKGCGKEALDLFEQMKQEGIKPDNITFVSVLDACASLANLSQGMAVHASIANHGFVSDITVGNALVNMYGKCGRLDDARKVFRTMMDRNVASWNAIIGAYAQNGLGMEALELFRWMGMERVKPDRITFITILFACSHTGLLDDGWHYFICMSRDHGISPTVEHYGCIIDLLGRFGQLEEAEDLMNNMPFEPDSVAWIALLGACRIHCNMELGARAAKHVFKLEPQKDAQYVLLSNIYASSARHDVAKVRKVVGVGGDIPRWPIQQPDTQ